MSFAYSSRVVALALLALSAGVQAEEAGIFDVYQSNRENARPNLITPDLLLTSYGLIRQQQNTQAELQTMIPGFKALVARLNDKLASARGGKTESLSRNYALLLQSLLTDSAPDNSSDALKAEWHLIRQAAGVAESPLWGIALDYSQFKPRGRYTQSEEMQRYYVAFRYAGTVNFYVSPSKASGVTNARAKQLRQVAFYLSRTIAKDAVLLGKYDALQSELTWEYGKPGDLDVKDFSLATHDFSKSALKAADWLGYARKQGRLPQIIDQPIDVAKLAHDEKIAEVALGWRLMPGVQNGSGVAIQTLLHPNTGVYSNPCGIIQCVQPWTAGMIEGKRVKAYVSVYEIMAGYGSTQARSYVRRQGEDSFEGYAKAATKVAEILQASTGLSGAQANFMREVFSEVPDAEGRQLTGMLGFWTWQQSINALYAKQAMSPSSKSLSFSQSPARKGAVLLGTAGFYASLGRLAAQQKAPVWGRFSEITGHLAELAKPGRTLNEEDERYLNELDTALLQLTRGKDQPIVVDVQTNPLEKHVVEEALGRPEIQELNGARGAWFRHYEFKQNMTARLSNEEWFAQLESR